VQAHFGANPRQSLSQEVRRSYPRLQRSEGILGRLPPQSGCLRRSIEATLHIIEHQFVFPAGDAAVIAGCTSRFDADSARTPGELPKYRASQWIGTQFTYFATFHRSRPPSRRPGDASGGGPRPMRIARHGVDATWSWSSNGSRQLMCCLHLPHLYLRNFGSVSHPTQIKHRTSVTSQLTNS